MDPFTMKLLGAGLKAGFDYAIPKIGDWLTGSNQMPTYNYNQQQYGQNPSDQYISNFGINQQSPSAEWFYGSPGQLAHIPRFTQPQMSALSSILGKGQNMLSNLLMGFEPIENQARQQLQQKTLPSIAERFTSLGNNAMSSPAFLSQLGGAASDLESNIAALKAQFGMQNRNQAMQLLAMGLEPQYQNLRLEAQPGFLGGQFMPALMGLGTELGKSAIQSYFKE